MDYKSLELEAQNKAKEIAQKWKTIKSEKYDGNFRKMHAENMEEMFEDISSLWEIAMAASLVKSASSFVTAEELYKSLENNT